MKKIIMTGGTGFIGSWLVEELLKNHVEVTLLVRNKIRVSKWLQDKVNIIEYNPVSIENIDVGNDFDVFYHLGWGGVAPTLKNSVDVQLDNVSNSVRAMQFAAKINCKRFIAAGTVAEYTFCDDIMDFNAKQTPNDIYGAAKTATYYFLDVLSRQKNLPLNWVILPSTFGERRTDNNIITYTIKSLLNGNRPKYGNLEQMWDFLYVQEVARALYLIGEKGTPNKTYGIGSGIYRPLKDYIKVVRDLINPNLELGIGDISSMSSKTFSSCVSILALTKDTGFFPQISFENGIKRTIEWFKKDEGLLK